MTEKYIFKAVCPQNKNCARYNFRLYTHLCKWYEVDKEIVILFS